MKDYVKHIWNKNKEKSYNIFKKNQELVVILEEEYNNSFDFITKIQLYMRDLNDLPICEYSKCNTPIQYKRGKFSICCSKKCHNLYLKENNLFGDINKKRKNTLIEKYGVEHQMQIPEVKEKISQTNLERYGTESYTKSEDYKIKTKKTSLEKYDIPHFNKGRKEMENNIKETCLELYEKHSKTKFKQLRHDLNGPILEYLKDKYGHGKKLSEYLYQGIYEKNTICKNGNQLKFRNIYDGYGFCAISCQCKKDHQSKIIKDIWKTVSEEELERRNQALKRTSLEKYGVDHYSQTDEYKEKLKRTSLEKYGVDHYSQTDEYKEKLKRTSLEKYGVEHHTQNQNIKKKIKETTIEKYGGMMTHARNASEEKYGGNVFASDWFKENRENIYQNALGVTHPTKSKEIKDKVSETNMKRYGANNYTKKHYNFDYVDVFNNVETFTKLLYKHGVYKLAEIINCDPSTIHKHTIFHGIILPPRTSSHQEENISDFLKEQKINVITNSRRILSSGKELDFYFPDHNLAIEINGLYWHSEISGGKDRKYHYNKWKECDDLGITLLSIQEDEFNENKQFWFNKILYMTGNMKPTKIHARKCEIRELDNVTDFLNYHHLQGSCASSYKFGLFYNDELVSVMTFSNTRNNDIGIIELSRFCNHSGYLVSGGASKLLSHFIKKYDHLYKSIISFSDNNYSNGKVYETLGFDLKQNLRPDYKYVINQKRQHKANFRKSSIFKKFDIPDDMKNKSEWMLMQYLGYDRIWDTGKKKWEMKI